MGLTGAVLLLVLLVFKSLRENFTDISQIKPQSRIWRRSLRRAYHFVIFRIKGSHVQAEERAKLEESFAIKSAEDAAKVLGEMKGAIMKAGQMLSFIADGLPPQAQAALASLQSDVPPMAPSLAESVIKQELGLDVGRLFLDWDPIPIAAASIGQVHKAVMPDGRLVAVKVQYPGVQQALKGDLDNAQLLYGIFSQFTLKGVDVKALVDELRVRMAEELDYTIEAGYQKEFYELYKGHPFIHIPQVIQERSSRKVLTTEWVEGLRWDEFLASSTDNARQKAGEILFRFSQACVHEHGIFNADPHPGNYRLHKDGSITFLDFGLVKRWKAGELQRLIPVLEAMLSQDAIKMVDSAIEAGFLPSNHGLDPELIYEYASQPYKPLIQNYFQYSKNWVSSTLHEVLDLKGRYGEVIKAFNMPAYYLLLDRLEWGINALLGRLEAGNTWRCILEEYTHQAPPCTALGIEEKKWKAKKSFSS